MEFVGYFPQWSIYGRKVFLKDIDDNGTAERLTILNYAFENITSGDVEKSQDYPESYTDYRAFEEVRPLADNGNTGKLGADTAINSGDAGADYLQPFNAQTGKPPIGSDDPVWDSKVLMGNFNQLRKLKDKHQKLKVLVSLGGWTYSRNWSSVAATQQSRQTFVSSCIDLYIKGNLPTRIWVRDWQEPHAITEQERFGGTGVAKGIFDGIDIDWEWPGCDKGLKADDGSHANKFDADHDKANFVELLKEFRKQLDDKDLLKAYPPRGGKYLLTAFLPADPGIMKVGWNAAEVMKCLDFGNIQGYDFHGGWDQKTDHQSAFSPEKSGDISVETAINGWVEAAGESAKAKLTFGIPYYGRGWEQVVADTAHPDGLHCKAARPVRQVPLDQKTHMPDEADFAAHPWKAKWEAGVNDYRDLAGLTAHGFKRYWNDKACTAWLYGSVTDPDTGKPMNVFWTLDDPEAAYTKAKKVKDLGVGGVMVYSLDGDITKTGDLAQNIRAGLDGEKRPTNGHM